MYHGTEQTVKIRFANDLAGVVIDRFGQDVYLRPVDENHFIVHVKVAVSRQFLAWVIGLGRGAKIMAPEDVAEEMKKTIKELAALYED